MSARRALGVFASRLTSTRRHKEAEAWKRVTCSCLSTAAGSDASSFVDVEASQERAEIAARVSEALADLEIDGDPLFFEPEFVPAALDQTRA